MDTTEKVTDILNDLIRINNDRIEGYEKAVDEIRDTLNAEIKALFFKMAEQSRSFKDELIEAVRQLGEEPATDTTASGKVYRVWMDIKSALSTNDINTTLQSCEFGEDAALKAYQQALEEEVAWPSDTAALVSRQRQALRASHDQIKQYRDQYKTINTL